MFTNRRVSSTSNNAMLNISNTFLRKIFIVVLDENNSATCYTAMQAACKFMSSPKNNRFNIPYIIHDSSDITPSNLPRVDEWVLDRNVIDIIMSLYDNVSSTCAESNILDASFFFTGPPFSQVAVQTLGYSNDTDGESSGDDEPRRSNYMKCSGQNDTLFMFKQLSEVIFFVNKNIVINI